MESPAVTDATTYIGQVKWFNNKSGYGFITVRSPGDKQGMDIFSHYSNIDVAGTQYKYLVQGEYVELSIVKSENEKHEYQAFGIKGLYGGDMMCQVRRNYKLENDKKKGSSSQQEPVESA